MSKTYTRYSIGMYWLH